MPLNWQQLAESDDFLSRNLIDNTFFWIETRKVRSTNENDPLVISKVVILKLLRKYVISPPKPNVVKCVNKLMTHQITKMFLQRLKDPQAVQDFKKHAKKYVELYLPECGFDICATDRYEAKSGAQEACIIARQEFNKDDEIKYLQGTFAELDGYGETQLDKNDFSVFNTTSNANSKLMLGPCRFVNHNCQANAKFIPSSNGVKIVAVTRILPGEEITVCYSPSYFGKDNRDCLCSSCEINNKGAYDPEREITESKIIDVSSSEGEDEEKGEGPETIVIDDTDDEAAKEEESVHEDDDGDDSDSDDLVNLDPKDFPGGIPDPQIPFRLKNLRHKSDEPFREPESEVVGGRRLRPRLMIKSSNSTTSKYSILMRHPRDSSFDSLPIENRDCDSDYLKKRRIQRTLHKLYMTSVYKYENFKGVFDCRHCGVYFELEPLHQYKEYCPRCTRHQKVFGLAWPFTRDHEDAIHLVLDASIFRYDIQDLSNRKLSGKGRSNIKRRLHGGIVMPVSKNPRDLINPISLKRFRDSEEPKSSVEASSNSSIKSDASSPIIPKAELNSPSYQKSESEVEEKPKVINGHTDRQEPNHHRPHHHGHRHVHHHNQQQQQYHHHHHHYHRQSLKNCFLSSGNPFSRPLGLQDKLVDGVRDQGVSRQQQPSTRFARQKTNSDDGSTTPPTISDILNSKPKVDPQALARTARERNGLAPASSNSSWRKPTSESTSSCISAPLPQELQGPQKMPGPSSKYYSPWITPVLTQTTAKPSSKPELNYSDVKIINVLSALEEKLMKNKKTREFKIPKDAEIVVLDSD